ncbi:MAG: hypothetical protein U0893_01400 [Chloroflexota bacterium]
MSSHGESRLSHKLQSSGDVSRRLDDLASLHDDWDSYGGAAPTAKSLAVARDLLVTLDALLASQTDCKVKLLHLGPLPTGGVQIEWRHAEVEVEVEVDPHGELSYLLVERQGDEERYHEEEHVSKQAIVNLIAGQQVLSERS